MSSDRDTTESPLVQRIASMVDVPVEEWDPRFLRALTTISSPVTQSTRNTTPSLEQVFDPATRLHFLSLPSPASSAPTSSSTQRLGESLSSQEKPLSEGWISEALLSLDRTLHAKNKDYRIDSEFSNFEFAAQMVGGGMSPDEVMLTQIAIKLGRLQGLPDDPRNESRMDTIKDLAGYAVILYGYSLSKVSHGQA